MSGGGWHDVFKVGRVRRNRVTVYRRRPGGVFAIRFVFRGQKVNRSLRTCNEAKAQQIARETAANIAEARRSTHSKPSEIMAMRADLIRVARMMGAPEGVAPSFREYDKHGRFSVARVRAAYHGYDYDPDTHAVNPRDQWQEAVKAFGFKPFIKHRAPNFGKVAADVRRVAHELGNPRRLPTRSEYVAHGRWSPTSVLRHLEADGWVEVGRTLELDMEAWRVQKAEEMRGNTLQSEAA